jgi:hypothetical protein
MSLDFLAITVLPKSLCCIYTIQNVIKCSRYYCTSKHILCIHTTKNFIKVSRYFCNSKQNLLHYTKHIVIKFSHYYYTSNTACCIHTTQYFIREFRYYCSSKNSLLYTHNTECHYIVSHLLYLQTHSAAFTQHKISLDSFATTVPLKTACCIHTTQNVITFSRIYCISKHILLHSLNTKFQSLISLLLYIQRMSSAFTELKISLHCLDITVQKNQILFHLHCTKYH